MKTRSLPANRSARESRVTPPTVFVSKPANSARPWSSWTTMSPVLRSANDLSAPRRRPAGRGRAGRRGRERRGAGGARALGAAATEQAVLGDDGEAQAGGDKAIAQARLGEAELRLGRALAVEP